MVLVLQRIYGSLNHCRRVQYGCTGPHILHIMSARSFIEMFGAFMLCFANEY